MTLVLPAAALVGLGTYILVRTDATRTEASGSGVDTWLAKKAAGASARTQTTGMLGDLTTSSDGRLQLGPAQRQPPQRQAKRLEAETPYFSGPDPALPVVERSITGKGFDKEFARLERQMALDPGASEVGQLYREALQQQFASVGLSSGAYRPACGRSLCMGSMLTRAPDTTYQHW